jgi:hypothetical protein
MADIAAYVVALDLDITFDPAAFVAITALLLCVYLGAVLERGGFFDWWHGDD